MTDKLEESSISFEEVVSQIGRWAKIVVNTVENILETQVKDK
jgi:hypothetical protein